jgi:nucleotide-binding universal stress UspA family protein
MSTIKNLLAVLSDANAGRCVLETTLAAQRHLDCHIDALHVRPDPVAGLPLVSEAMAGSMVEEMMAIAEKESAARAEAVRAMYGGLIAGNPRAGWIEASGAEDQIVAVRACRADLIVLARPTRDNETAAVVTLNAALMQSGRPVLASPPGAGAAPRFARIAIFWNGSTEATRAVAAALPFLVRAERVTVLRVQEEEWFAPTEDLEAYLGHHGVAMELAKVPPGQTRTGPALLAATAEAGTDMMIMGAYTRSKLRQLMLGSVTGHVMQHATLPVLLCR